MNNQQRAENAIKWIETLLKTRMKQGTDCLGSRFLGRCCLGVGCHILDVDYDPDATHEEGLVDVTGLHNEFGAPQDRYERRGGEEALWVLNDEKEFTFKQIAQRIIEKPSVYFRPGVAKLIKKHFAEV